MAAVNPQGDMQYWNEGFPFGGVKKGTLNEGEMQYWDNGFPIIYNYPASTSFAYSFGLIIG